MQPIARHLLTASLCVLALSSSASSTTKTVSSEASSPLAALKNPKFIGAGLAKFEEIEGKIAREEKPYAHKSGSIAKLKDAVVEVRRILDALTSSSSAQDRSGDAKKIIAIWKKVDTNLAARYQHGDLVAMREEFTDAVTNLADDLATVADRDWNPN